MPTSSTITLNVNGQQQCLDVPGDAPLLFVLRNDLRLNGPKYGCGLGECGACSVLINGRCARSCVIPVRGAAGRAVTTLEGLGNEGGLHPVQRAFIEEQAAQCGYCMNGMIMATVALLQATPAPTEQQIRDALAHNLCRCGTHIEILNAVRRAIQLLASAEGEVR